MLDSQNLTLTHIDTVKTAPKRKSIIHRHTLDGMHVKLSHSLHVRQVFTLSKHHFLQFLFPTEVKVVLSAPLLVHITCKIM